MPSVLLLMLLAGQAVVSEPGVTADAWAAQARDQSVKGAVFEALDSYDRALQVEPGRMDIRQEYAGLLKTAGFWLRSAEQYKTILKARPDAVDALIGFGELLNAEYQFISARDQFARALQLEAEAHVKERAQVGLGSAQYGLEDYASAAQTFESLLQGRPNVLSAIAFLAIAKRKLGDLQGAERLWNRFLDSQPESSRAKIHLEEIQALRSAIEKSRQSVQAAPDNAFAWAGLGDLLRQQPDLPGALEAFEAAKRLSPADAGFVFAHGVVLRDLKRCSEAAGDFAALGKNPQYGALALYNMAHCARVNGDRRSEAKAWAGAASLNPKDFYAFKRHVRALGNGPEFQLERAAASQGAKGPAAERAGDPMPSLRLAVFESAAGNLKAAQRAALDALARDLNDVHAQRLLRDLLLLDDPAVKKVIGTAGPERLRGAVLLALSRESEAEPLLRKALQAQEGDVQVMVALASCLKASGRQEERLALLESARAARPDYLYAHLDLALGLLDAGRFRESIEAARAAVRLEPDNPIGYSILGVALRGAGNLNKSAEALSLALSIDPIDDQGAPRLMLAKVYGAMGRLEEARRVLRGDLPEEPEEIYRMAWEFVRDTYHDRTFRGQDWRKWQHRFEGRLHSTAEALGAVALMLSSLDDRNTRLRSPEQTASLLFTPRADKPEFNASGAALSTSKTVEAKQLEGNVGYIAITNLDDPKLPGDIQKAVDGFKTADGVILDLRGNQGGSDSQIPQIAGMFVKPGTPTGSIVGPQGTTKVAAAPAPGTTEPIVPEGKPVVVLVDHNTASSAENLAGSLKEARRATLVGEKTFGKAGIQMPRLLPGGAIVLVVGAEHADLRGAVYTGVGIQPDVTVVGSASHAPGGVAGDDPTVRRAREILRKKKGGP